MIMQVNQRVKVVFFFINLSLIKTRDRKMEACKIQDISGNLAVERISLMDSSHWSDRQQVIV